jgi:hypothetical protein
MKGLEKPETLVLIKWTKVQSCGPKYIKNFFPPFKQLPRFAAGSRAFQNMFNRRQRAKL